MKKQGVPPPQTYIFKGGGLVLRVLHVITAQYHNMLALVASTLPLTFTFISTIFMHLILKVQSLKEFTVMLFHEHTHVLAATRCNMSQLEVSQDSEDLTSQPAAQGSFQVITVNMVTSSNTLPFTFGKFGKLHLVHYISTSETNAP